ncbi:hypothetical protein L1987_71441 [Smallanthus sonchifolius]|uniref:Uncharacterized protein n=1 Tax=Smallanthus sonchifolius TaxID=185202 RepID=A0ACB9ASS4_9ASTR|nr:hypothetical protein L1987_71441 [Smallanthus sonchifolius]
MDLVKFFHMNGGMGEASYASNSGLQNGNNENKRGDRTSMGSMVINAVTNTSLDMGLKSPEVQINLNDLPTNDFNTIFMALQELQGNTTNGKKRDVHHQPSCYFTGVPGSFFGRLFPMKSLNFVHSSYGLQWLSQLPELDEVNKGNIYLSSTSPESVSRAYLEQFQKDFLGFLRCRSEELMAGGRMVLTLAGRTTDDPRVEENPAKSYSSLENSSLR